MNMYKGNAGLGVSITSIMTHQERDRLLHQLYSEKQYYVFFYGLEYFNKLIENIHMQYTGSEFGNDWAVDRIIWEIDNLGEQ